MQRRQRIDLGGVAAFKSGAPSPFADLYYATMEMGWPAFLFAVASVFVALNVAFGLVYATMPGAIANMAPGSLTDGFFFSADALATVGYGVMAPATHAGHAVAAAEMLTGLFYSATITGLTFARFARPRTSFVFAQVAVIGRMEGRPTLMVRMASLRRRPMANVAAHLSWFERVRFEDGREMRRLVELPLVRARNPVLGLSWTIAHTIEDGSAMLRALTNSEDFRIVVTVVGLDTLLANQAVGSRTYRREDILADHEYEDAVTPETDGFHLDLAKLDAVRPIGG